MYESVGRGCSFTVFFCLMECNNLLAKSCYVIQNWVDINPFCLALFYYGINCCGVLSVFQDLM